MKEESADSGASSDQNPPPKVPLSSSSPPTHTQNENPLAVSSSEAPNDKTLWQKLLPVVACGAGLFSDGYINNVTSPPFPTFPHQSVTNPQGKR